MGYTDQQAMHAAMAQADKYKSEVLRLRGAIVEHYQQIHQHNWGFDDELWATVGLTADVEVIG